MTQRKNFKRRIRARMEKTGESYSIAKKYLENRRLQSISSPSHQEVARVILSAASIQKIQLGELRASLQRNPYDLLTRASLLGYYFHLWSSSAHDRERVLEVMAEQRPLILWAIEHCPHSPLISAPPFLIIKGLDPEGYELAKALWLKVASGSENLQILRNAAGFFRLSDPELAESFLLEAKALDEESSEVNSELGDFYGRKKDSVKGLSYLEKSLENAKDDEDRLSLATKLTRAAFKAGQLDKAKIYATELLALAQTEPEKSGDAHYHGHLTLASIAYEEERFDEACEQILEAAKTQGSPVLRSFGPDFELIGKLARRGYRDCAREYLKSCQRFWPFGVRLLEDWLILLEEDKLPSFDRKEIQTEKYRKDFFPPNLGMINC